MAGVICEEGSRAAQLHNQLLRHPTQSLKGGVNQPRSAKPKYDWRPEFDAYLKAQYFGGLNRRFRVLNRMIRLTGLPRWYIKRQAARLGLTMHMDRRPWTRAELDVLDDLVGRVSAATIAKRLHRPVSSVVNKCKRLQISRRVRNGYTIRDLELCLGEITTRFPGGSRAAGSRIAFKVHVSTTGIVETSTASARRTFSTSSEIIPRKSILAKSTKPGS